MIYDFKYGVFLHLILIIVFGFVYKSLGTSHFAGITDESIDYFYLSSTIQSTVGFGDIIPKTKLAKKWIILQDIF